MTVPPDDEEIRFLPDGGCFGCSPSNPVGLRLPFRRRGEVAYARYTIPDHFHGAPGIAHGGIVATILDEVSCAAAAAVGGRFVVTGELSVRYRRPCPVGAPLEAAARITEETPRYFVIEADLRRDDQVLARSTGKFFFQQRPEPAP
jgi:uncharacterized protein (TIGR00369 family)